MRRTNFTHCERCVTIIATLSFNDCCCFVIPLFTKLDAHVHTCHNMGNMSHQTLQNTGLLFEIKHWCCDVAFLHRSVGINTGIIDKGHCCSTIAQSLCGKDLLGDGVILVYVTLTGQ